jgi:hypothetical protein
MSNRLCMRKVTPMARSSIALPLTEQPTERRSRKRQRMVLRVGVLSDGKRTSFCLVRNISPFGVQVKLYGQLEPATEVNLRVGDEKPLAGHVAWVRDEQAGIQFHSSLDPQILLRVTQKLAPIQRRSLPRVNAVAHTILSTGGRRYPAKLCDISASGARVRTHRPISAGPHVMLTLPDMPSIKTYVRWAADNDLGLAFETPLPIQIIAEWVNGRVNVFG